MTEYRFDLSTVRSLDDWWDQYAHVVNGKQVGLFGRNRDAYRDSLRGGPGAPEMPCRFTFTNVAALDPQSLQKSTREELERKRTKAHPANIEHIDSELRLLTYGIGETLLNWILDPPIEAGIEVLVKPGA
ncbi:MAG TPA: hypothetical protein VFI41_02450 [Gemmatimonadales bacterium]|jgi:hypothetical protein|nr:hypothetical protein [Gemmatimonadales bacterium]